LFQKYKTDKSLPPCPICGKQPKVKIELGSANSGYVRIGCIKRNKHSFYVSSGKATLEQAIDSARSQWFKKVREYPKSYECYLVKRGTLK